MRGAAPSPSDKKHIPLTHSDVDCTLLCSALGASCSCGSVLDRDSEHAFNDTVDLFTALGGYTHGPNTPTNAKIDYLSLEWSREG